MRGLKCEISRIRSDITESHPLWMRGLKCFQFVRFRLRCCVASFMDAWIEIIRTLFHLFQNVPVASFMDAWIEILQRIRKWERKSVASFMDAWIEIIKTNYFVGISMSHPLWMRGLKLYTARLHQRAVPSHPLWMRGLKSRKLVPSSFCKFLSHPLWMRGLKYLQPQNISCLVRRILYGCVD